MLTDARQKNPKHLYHVWTTPRGINCDHFNCNLTRHLTPSSTCQAWVGPAVEHGRSWGPKIAAVHRFDAHGRLMGKMEKQMFRRDHHILEGSDVTRRHIHVKILVGLHLWNVCMIFGCLSVKVFNTLHSQHINIPLGANQWYVYPLCNYWINCSVATVHMRVLVFKGFSSEVWEST